MPARNKSQRLPRSVRGAGGKSGGGTRVAREDPDSLSSRQLANLIDALSEGEIEGFDDPDHPLRCVALSGTPVENPDGSLNYKDFDFFFLPGSQEQSYVPGFEAAENVTAVGVELRNAGGPWVQRFNDGSIDAVRINIRIPQLRKVDTKTGDIAGTSVQIKIEVQGNNGGYVQKVLDTIKGKASSPYIRGYRLELADIPAPWDIRVTRMTVDTPTPASVSDQTFIDSHSQITYGKLRYPNTALVAVRINAEQFGSIPTRAYHMKGLIIRVPKNYDPIARTYDENPLPAETQAARGVSPSGTWDGTFKLAWTNNPAWCYYDLATHKRYGLGNYMPESSVNKYALYVIAKYCDVLVPDGKGGQEPRFACNLYLQKREDAMKVLTDMTTIFRGMHYFANGVLEPIQDSPRNPDILFGPSNVINGVFAYSGTGRRARHTAALVTYNNENNFGEATPEPFEDGDAILRYGYNPLEITNFGCTSQMAARRQARWAITAENILHDTVSFEAGAEGFRARPGWIAQIINPFRSGKKFTGKILARTATAITLDREIEIEAGKTYWISLTIYDPAEENPEARSKVIAVQVLNGAGNTSVINVAALAIQPDAGTVWQLANDDVNPELFRILNVTPKDNATVEILALQYNASIYAHIDDDAPLVEPPTNAFPTAGAVKPPGVVTIEQVTVNDPVAGVSRDLHISWIRSPDLWIRGYRVSYRFNSGNWVPLPESPASESILERVIPGIYEFSVIAINRFGKASSPSLEEVLVDVASPLAGATVTGLEIVGQGNVTDFSTRDVQFGWRFNSPANAAAELLDDARSDPFFEAFLVRIYEADTTNILQDSVYVTQPTYTHTLEKNIASGGPYPDFTIGVRILDKFNNLSEEARLTVHKVPPLAPTAPFNVIPTISGVNVQWTSPVDSSRARYDIMIDDPLSAPIASTSGDSSQKAIDGITGNSFRFFLVRAVDVYGLTSAILELGWAKPGQVNEIADVTFIPDGGAVNFLGTGISNVHLSHPDPEAEIWFRVNDATPPTNNPADGSVKYFDGLLAVNPPDTNASFTAAAFVRGLWGLPKTRDFTLNPSGGGTTDAAVTPEFDLTPGTYDEESGERVIHFGTPGADAIFYTKSVTGSEPDDPAHDGGGNPTGTTIKVAADSVELILLRGSTIIKAMAVAAGLDDSAIARAQYYIRKTVGVPV